MKRTDYISVGDVCRLAFEEFNLTSRLLERRACELWRELVGPGLAAMTTAPQVVRGGMRIGVASAPLRHELTMSRSGMINLIHQRLGRDVISEIRFVAPGMENIPSSRPLQTPDRSPEGKPKS